MKLPPDLIQAYRTERARRSLAWFIRDGWHVLEPTTKLEWWWHHDALCLHVQAALEDWMRHQLDPSYVQRIQTLIANVPPGTLKSRIFSVYAPAWMWTRWPSWRVIALSANPQVALRDASYSRQVIESDWYRTSFRPAWQIREDTDAKGNFANTAGGFRLSQGWGAKSIGSRAHCILPDDPNNMADIHSSAHREGVIESWDMGWANRRNDMRTDLVLAIQQRGHERDFTGHVLTQPGTSHLCIPMEWEPDHPFAHTPARPTAIGWTDPRTVAGQVLQPERFTPAVLATERARGSFYYAGQFQQRPAPAGGGLFRSDQFRFWKPDGIAATDRLPRPQGCWPGPPRALPAKLDEIVISLDAAFKGAAHNDRVAFQVWGKHGADRYLLDSVHGNMTFTETKERVRQLAAKWPTYDRLLVEDKANGSAIIDDLQRTVARMIPVNPEGGKESRAHRAQPEIEAGNVFLPDGHPCLEAFIGECCAFPNGAHDDQVDAMTQALNAMAPTDGFELYQAAYGR